MNEKELINKIEEHKKRWKELNKKRDYIVSWIAKIDKLTGKRSDTARLLWIHFERTYAIIKNPEKMKPDTIENLYLKIAIILNKLWKH